MMTEQEFEALAHQGYNRIPVTREVLADLDTPLSSYLKLARGPYSYLFESVHQGEKWGRYSIIGLPCRTVLKVRAQQVEIETDGVVVETQLTDDPLAYIEQFQQRYRVAPIPHLAFFNGGLVGYFAYDVVRYVESRLAESSPPDQLGTPDILLMLSEDVLVFDNLSGVLTLITLVDPSVDDALPAGQQRLSALAAQLPKPTPDLPAMLLPEDADANAAGGGEQGFTSGLTQGEFEAAVERIKEYVRAGDVMQVVPSQRLSVAFDAEPINLYRALRRTNPSPYMYYLDLGDFHIVGSSPEILSRLQNNEVVVRPLAGTRPRGLNAEEDRALEKELLADPKELAEHLMLIDLGRNDIGRVAQTGSVQVSDQMAVERYSHVMHIVSNVSGQLRDGLNAMDVLRASLPAGTLSGAPKIRAMQIIDEVEPVRRGIYGGAVGYLAWNGNMDTAIAIRTAVIKDGQLHIQAGAGIVADSVPHLEWEETMNKAGAMFRAVAMVQGSDG
jgi:anthranilate synthase component 1